VSEPQASLSEPDRASKRIGRMLARWRVERGRSKSERIENKMTCNVNPGLRRIKRVLCVGASKRNKENTVALQKYTPVFRARGTY
jgi:hypothetical protein